MATDDYTYVIDPDATDPALLRSLTSLGDDPGQPAPRTGVRMRRRVSNPSPIQACPPLRRPALWLTGVFVLGPFAMVLADSGARRLGGALGAVAVLLASGATWIWFQEPWVLGGGDRAILIQGLAIALAAILWFGAWSAGLLIAVRRCPEGPLSRRDKRRPLVAGLVGFLAPGLGLLLAGRRVRCVIAIALVGVGGLAILALTRAAAWWTWHQSGPSMMWSDLALERTYATLACLAVLGAATWLVSALDAGRLARGPRVVRAIGSVDRIPAALLITLAAFGFLFQPGDVAGKLDRLSCDLADNGLRLIPLWSAQAASALAPAEPLLSLRVAAREEALGNVVAAAAIRERLQQRWQRYGAAGPAAAVSDGAPTAEGTASTGTVLSTGGKVADHSSTRSGARSSSPATMASKLKATSQ